MATRRRRARRTPRKNPASTVALLAAAAAGAYLLLGKKDPAAAAAAPAPSPAPPWLPPMAPTRPVPGVTPDALPQPTGPSPASPGAPPIVTWGGATPDVAIQPGAGVPGSGPAGGGSSSPPPDNFLPLKPAETWGEKFAANYQPPPPDNFLPLKPSETRGEKFAANYQPPARTSAWGQAAATIGQWPAKSAAGARVNWFVWVNAARHRTSDTTRAMLRRLGAGTARRTLAARMIAMTAGLPGAGTMSLADIGRWAARTGVSLVDFEQGLTTVGGFG